MAAKFKADIIGRKRNLFPADAHFQFPFAEKGITMNMSKGRLGWILPALLLLCSQSGAAQTNSQFGGRWEADGMPAGPWIFELSVDGSTVTGRAMQHGGIPGPSPIYQGKVEGGTIVFKSRNPIVSNVTKEVTFKGVLSGNVIAFERSIEILLNGTNDATLPQENGLFGSLGPTKFAAKRVGPVPMPPVPVERTAGIPLDATGKWESLRWIWIVGSST